MSDRKKVIRLVWINTIAVLLTSLLIIAGIFYFSSKKMEVLQAELSTLQGQVALMKKKKMELPAISKHLPRLLNESKQIALLFPTETQQRQLIEFLQQNADKARADVVGIAMDPPKELEALKKSDSAKTEEERNLDKAILEKTKSMITGFEIRGSFESVLAFMENLKRSGRFYRVLKIQGKPAGSQVRTPAGFISGASLTFDLEGEMYITEEKLDIAAKFAKLRDELNRVLAVKEVVAEEPEAPGLQEVMLGGSSDAATKAGETPE